MSRSPSENNTKLQLTVASRLVNSNDPGSSDPLKNPSVTMPGSVSFFSGLSQENVDSKIRRIYTTVVRTAGEYLNKKNRFQWKSNSSKSVAGILKEKQFDSSNLKKSFIDLYLSIFVFIKRSIAEKNSHRKEEGDSRFYYLLLPHYLELESILLEKEDYLTEISDFFEKSLHVDRVLEKKFSNFKKAELEKRSFDFARIDTLFKIVRFRESRSEGFFFILMMLRARSPNYYVSAMEELVWAAFDDYKSSKIFTYHISLLLEYYPSSEGAFSVVFNPDPPFNILDMASRINLMFSMLKRHKQRYLKSSHALVGAINSLLDSRFLLVNKILAYHTIVFEDWRKKEVISNGEASATIVYTYEKDIGLSNAVDSEGNNLLHLIASASYSADRSSGKKINNIKEIYDAFLKLLKLLSDATRKRRVEVRRERRLVKAETIELREVGLTVGEQVKKEEIIKKVEAEEIEKIEKIEKIEEIEEAVEERVEEAEIFQLMMMEKNVKDETPLVLLFRNFNLTEEEGLRFIISLSKEIKLNTLNGTGENILYCIIDVILDLVDSLMREAALSEDQQYKCFTYFLHAKSASKEEFSESEKLLIRIFKIVSLLPCLMEECKVSYAGLYLDGNTVSRVFNQHNSTPQIIASFISQSLAKIPDPGKPITEKVVTLFSLKPNILKRERKSQANNRSDSKTKVSQPPSLRPSPHDDAL